MASKLSQHIEKLRENGVLGQLIRYGISGGGITLLGGGIYTGLVLATPIHPQAAMFLSYVVCVAIGYVLHSRWSFRGHGSRDNPAKTTWRFFAVSLVSYGLNAFWTWLLVFAFGLPDWTPVLPLLVVTPLATFALNRQWVFG